MQITLRVRNWRRRPPNSLARDLTSRAFALVAAVGAIASPNPSPAQQATIDDTGSHPLAEHLASTYHADLQGVIERRYLRVLTSDNAFDYFIDRGRPRGFQFEMVKSFVDELNRRHPPPKGQPKIQFELLPVPDGDLIPMLIQGRGDMIAARLTSTKSRSAQVAFSRPYREVDEVIVQRRGGHTITKLRDLSGLSVSVRRRSSYHESLVRANSTLRAAGHAPILIDRIDETLPTERILALVASGAIERTVADSLIAETAAALHPELEVVSDFALRRGGQLAWAVHHTSKSMLKAIDAFLPRYTQGSLHGNIAASDYFESLRPVQLVLEESGVSVLSPYDEYFKHFGSMYGFDWRLIAAVAWQESRFDQSAHNRWGATGLFQIKPETAAEPYINIPDIAGKDNARNNAHAAIKYLSWIKTRYFDPIDDMPEKDRIRMMLAAYNAGPRSVLRARDRATKMGLDPNLWFRNVELAMLALRKREPVGYVSQINQSYVAYLLLGVE